MNDSARSRYRRSDPAGIVQALCICRDAMKSVCAEVSPEEPVHHSARMVIAAVEAFATLLTEEMSKGGLTAAADPTTMTREAADQG